MSTNDQTRKGKLTNEHLLHLSSGPRRTYLTKQELREFRDLLIKKRQDLLPDISLIGQEALDKKVCTTNSTGVDNCINDASFELLEKEWLLLREINAALDRIQDGTYGICLATDQPIHKERLMAQPWARYCIEYARLLERQKGIKPVLVSHPEEFPKGSRFAAS